MGKSFEFKECERFLKRVLKDKGMYSKGAVIAFLITGGIGFFAPPAQAIIYVETDLDSGATGASSYSNGNGNIHLPRNSVVFAPIRNGNVYGDLNRTAKNSVIIGAGSYAHGIVEGAREEKFTAVGNNAHVAGGQGTAIGSNTFAVKQATAVGNDVYAAGDSSIAIGNDDISTKYKDSLSRETLKGIFGNGESNDPAVAKLFREGKWYSSENDAKGPFKLTSWSDFNRSYLSDGTEMYSPTYAGGVGAIAIGSRSIAYKDGSTAIGTLSYAFGEGSTAMGLRAYTAENAKGAVAIGEQSRSFAPQSLAVGNRNESTDDGAMSYGYSAKAVGKGSLAFGYKTYANASIANNIAAADGHSATNPLRQAVRSKLGNYSETQLAALETYQNKAREYYAKIDARASEAAIAAAKTAMDNAKADVDAITLTDVNAMALVDGGQVSHQGWNTVGNTIKSVVDAVEDKNATNKLTVEKLDGVYLTTKDEDGNTQTVQKSKKSGDNAIAIGYYASAKGTSAIAEGSGSVVDSLSGIGIGSLSYVSENSANSIAVGVGAQVRKENSIAIGTQSQVFGAGAIGMGPGSRVMGDNSVAMGYGTDIRSVSSIGLGVRAKVGYGSMNATGLGANVNIGTDAGNTVALGSSASIGDNSLNSMAVGYNANVANNTPNSIAFGTRARIAEGATSSLAVGDLAAVTKSSSTALGRLATADFENSVALGYRSNTHYWGNPNTRESNFSSSASDSNKHGLSIAPYLPQGSTLGDKLKKLDSVTAGYVSVGGWDEKDANGRSTGRRGLRRIVNVAPGALDTDAVTVAQLRDWTDKSAHFLSIAGASNKAATDYPDINDPLGTKSNNKVVKIKSNFDNDTATGTNALALGVYAYANGQKSVAMGPNAYANVDHGVAIGDSAQAWSEGSNGNAGVAIGKEAKAYYWNALALGTNARVSGSHSLAFGPNARVGVVKTVDAATGNVTNKGTMVNDGIAIGRDTAIDGTGSIALGAASNVTTATNAVAIGTSAQVLAGKGADNKAVQATGAVALGSNASVTGSQYSVALGLNSSVVQDDTKEKTRAAFTNEEINDPGNGVVSVGNNTTVKRRIINVASGVNDNDAVTVKQLKAVAPKYYSVNTTEADNRTVNSVNDVKSNVNNDGATGAGAVAVGSYTRATGNYSSAIGRDVITSAQLSTGIGTNVTVSGDKSVGIGNNVEVSNHSAVAIGLEAKSDHARGIAVGYKVNVNESDTFAGGSEVNVTGYGSVGIGKKVETRANNAVGIGASTNALGSESIALGYAAYTGYTTTENIANPPAGGPTTRTVYNGATEGVAIGKEAVVESNYAIAIGGNAKVKRDGTKDAESSVAIGAGAKVTGAKYSVALGLNSEVNASDTATKTTAAFSGESNDDPSNGVVSVGKSGKYRRILNVAGGVNDNDAVNVKQLKQAAWGLKTQSGTAAATGVTPDANGKVTLKAGNNVTIDNANGVVTVNATGIQSVSSGNANALNVTTTNGAVTITPNLAGTITGTGNDANKLVTAGVVNTALNAKANVSDLAAKLDKTAELHVRAGDYTVANNGEVSLIQEDASGTQNSSKGFKIKGLATKGDITNINTTLAGKADKSYVDTQIGTVSNLGYKAAGETAKQVAVGTGLTFTPGTGTVGATGTTAATTNAVTTKTGIAISTAANGVVNIGLDAATRSAIDNAATKSYVDTKFGNTADKNLSNLNTAGEEKVKDLAAAAVKVAAGKNVAVTPKTTNHVTTYTVDAIDTKVAAGEGLEVTGGTEDTNKVRAYTVGLSADTKAKLAKVDNLVNTVGTIGADGRDGKAGTGKDPKAADAAAGDKGLTGKDGLNGKDLTSKVNALRNGEAGTVVYTDENGNRLVKANDGNYYPATAVDKDGNVLNNTPAATTVQARLVNPDGTTTGGTTKLSNIADGEIAAGSTDAINGGQLHSKLAEKADKADITTINNTLAGKVDKSSELHVKADTYKVGDDGVVTVKQEDGTGAEATDKQFKISGLATKTDINNINTELGQKANASDLNTLAEKTLTFSGDTGTDATRKLGTTLAVKGAANFTPAATATPGVNIQVASDPTNGLTVSLADTLTNMKGISGNGKDPLVIKNGDQSITITPTTAAETRPEGTVTKPAQVGKVDFGNSKVTSSATPTEANDLVNKGYLEKAIEDVNSVATGNAKLGYKANAETDIKKVAVGTGLHFKSGTGTIGATGADAATPKTGIAISTEENGVVNIGLDEATRKVLDNAAKLGDTAVDGRDGKPGTGDNAGMGKDGLTKEDGLNGKDLTSKVNALRNGEAGTVVYTDENGKRVVKANDGKWYPAEKVDAKGNKLDGATEVATPQARLVNPDGTTTGGTTKLSNIADGEIAAGSHDAVTGGQLFTKLAEKADKSVVDNLTTKVNTNTTDIAGLKTTVDKAITFKGDDNQGVERKLDTTLTVKGAANFDPTGTNPATAAGVNIRVEKDTTTNANGLVVKLADTLTGMKGISGNGTNDLVIKNGDTVVTVKPGTNGAKGDVDFGGSKLTNIGTPGANTDAANKSYVDTQVGNAADKNLSNLNTAGEEKVKDLAAAAVKVAAGKNVAVTPKTTNHVTTYTVDAIDTKVAAGEGLEVTGGTEDTNKVRAYTVGLSADTKAKLAKVDNLANTVGTIGADGRDGKAGTGKAPEATDATAGDKGLTGKDGLNGKDLTSKVNALRNGEAGTVVYTDENGNRLAKANDGNYYPATAVDKDGNVLNNTPAATTVQARLVNPNGTTTGGTTKLSNIADGEIKEGSTDAINGGQLHSKLAEKADKADITTINNTLAGKVDKSSELHVKADTYAVGDDGVVTVKQEDGTGAEATGKEFKISGLATKTDITNINNSLNDKANISDLNSLKTNPITFTGDDAQAVTRALGTTLTVKGAANFDPTGTNPATTAGVNIRVEKDPTTNANGLVVKLADTLTNMKGISGNGADPLTIKNGDNTVITVKPGANGAKGDVDFGGSKLTNVGAPGANTDAANKFYVDEAIKAVNQTAAGNANLGYKANAEEAKTVAVTTGLHFKSGTGTVGATGADATTTNAATTKTGIAISTEENGVVNIGLDETTRKVLDNAAKLGDTAVDGRDGKPGTGDNAGMGKDGLTKADGLNGKDLTSKVNALRNGEAGSVVYTDDQGNRVVKADDGKWYNAKAVDENGKLKSADQLPQGVTADEVKTPQARLVNPDGTTTGGTTVFNNVASAILAAAADGAKPTFLDNLNTAAGDAKTKNVAVNVSDLNSTATEIIAKGLTFQGNDAQDIKKQLGETLHIVGEGTVPATTTTAANNIRTKKTNDGKLEIGLAKDLVGITSVTNAATSDGAGTKLALDGDSLTITNTQPLPEGAAPGTAPTVTTVTIGKDGINAGNKVISNVATPAVGTDAANKDYVDTQVGNAANKDLSNLNDAGINKVKDLAAAAVKVAAGKNTKVTADDSTPNTTTYVVDANDTVVTSTDTALAVTGGEVAGDNVRTYKLALSKATKDTLAKVDTLANTVGTIGADGRDGKAGTGKDPKATDAAAGDKGLTGQDGLNGKDLTSKVNALRNGEAGTVVYTDENGNRLVKANDGNYYPATAVDKDGNVLNNAQPATTVQARLVNPDGSATTAEGAAGTKLSNIANGTIADKSKDAVNGGQLHTAKQELATALGGNATVTNGVLTGPTYEITKDDGTNGKDSVNNVGAAIDKLDTRINTVKGLATQPLTFTGDDGQAVKRELGTTLTVKGAKNFTPSATTPVTEAGVNIRVEKDTTTNANGLVVKLADTLTNMKGITGNGKDPLVIQNGDQSITITPTTAAETSPDGAVTKPAQVGKVDFGNSKITSSATPTETNDLVNKGYLEKAIENVNNVATGNASLGYKANTEDAKSVNVNTGLHFKSGTGTIDATGTGAATTNAATTKTGIAISTEENGVVNIGLDAATRKVIDSAAKLGNTATDGRDGKAGTGKDPKATDAVAGDKGLTGQDGLNGKDLTSKVNALRNGEAGTVVYTDDKGNRVVKANDGNYYKADDVKADGTVKTADENGGKAPEVVTAPQARLVNPDGTTTTADTATGTKLSNIANGTIADKSKDAVNGGQLHTAKQEMANALGGNAGVDANGALTQPTYSITKDDATGGTDTVNNVGAAVSKLDTRINTVKEMAAKPLTFTGDDAQDVTRALGTTLTVKGAKNFTPSATTPVTEAGVNIRVEKDTTTNANGLVVKLADTLTNMKGISGNGTDNLVIKNGTNTITVTPGKAEVKDDQGTVTTPADPGKVNFGDATVTVKNLEAPITYRANSVADDKAKSVSLKKGLDFVAGDGTAATATAAKAGLHIETGDDGKVIVGLSDDAKTKLDKVNDIAKAVGANGVDGRDGKAGTGKDPKAADATAGDKGLTGKDGLNGKDLTSKVNALRNGEAGTVVYTDETGNRLVKANDGQYYPATAVDKDGNVLNNTPAATTVEAHLVNPDGTTVGGTTKLSNIADGEITADSKDAINGGQLHTKLAEKADKSDITTINNTLAGKANASDLNTLAEKPLTFSGDTGTNATRKLGETLAVKGAANFTPAATATAGVNIQVASDPTKGLTVSLADTLTEMKGISGNGKDPLTIKNGDNAVITVKPGAAGAKGDVDFGGSKLTNVGTPGVGTDAANKNYVDTKVGEATAAAVGNAKLGYKANAETDVKQVAVGTGLHFKSGTGTIAPTDLAPNTESTTKDTDSKEAKTGIAITTEENGVVNIGLDEATRKVIDNAAKIGNTATDGRDGKAGTGKDPKAADAVAGDKGLTGKDGLNGKDLTSKVNALRNGEAGTVVYTDDQGNRLVKANDGKWYNAKAVTDKGELKSADQLPQGVTATPVDAPQARLVNPDGSTTTATKLSNIADGTIGENSKDAINGGQLHTALAGKANISLDNLSNEGENKVKDLAAAAVKVAAGKNTKVTVDDSTPNTTTYVVDANDTIVTSTDTALTVTGGEVAGDNVRTYKLGLSQATKDTLAKVADIAKAVGADGANGIDGRDGKPGTGDNAGMGKDGLTGADGLNGKDLTTKVNALRNGEAGTVVYTDDKGNRVVKASDGKWYPADKVKADGTKADDAVEVKTPQARLVNPDGSTTGGTTVINNVASAIPAAPKDNANSPFLDRLNTAAGDVNTKHAAVNVSDLNNTAKDIIAKGLTFQGDDVKDVTRALGTTLTVKGATNFTPAADATAGVNIRVEKDTTAGANGLVVKLADTLTDMKGISGNGKDNLVIKNGTNTITVTPGKAAEGDKKATPGTVNFGDATVTVKDLDAPITYRTNGDADEKAKTVSLKQGLDFVTGDGTTNTAESAKPGLNIVTGENGKVIIGLSDDAATKLGKVDGIAAKVDAVEKALDNKADKSTVEDLANKLADKADKATVKDLADKVDGKADKSTVADLAKTVDGKADKSELDKKADKGEVTALANKAMTFTGNKADETVDRKLGETLHLVGTNNITVEKDANKDDTLNVKLASTLTGMESITTKAVDGLSNTTWDPTKVASAEEAKAKPDSDAAKERSKAATQGQLKDVADRVSKGRVFTADTKDGKDPLKAEVGLGDTLAIQGGATGELTDKNIGVELAPAKDGKPATMTVKLAKDLNMADGKSKYDRYLPEFEKTDKGLLKLDAKGNPIPKKDKDGNVILQKDGNGNPIVNSSTVVNGNGTTYTVNNLLSDGKVQVDNANKPVAGLVTTTTAAGTRYEERLTTEDGHVIFKQDDNTKELKPVLKTVSVVDSRGIRIGSNDKPVVSLTKDGLDNGGNTISNVAPGVYESDAATVGQLNAATNTVTAKVNEAGAHAAALAAMNPLSYDPLKKSQVMAGVGAYKGNKALALGVAHYANEDTMFNVGVSVGGGSNMMNAGVTYRFGGEDSMIPERYKGGPISSVYILQDEVSALKAENAQVKADNEQVKADNARMKENYEKVMQDNEEMKAQIKMLMAHMGIK
ncbi:YadA-like family protein [Veillonella sp. CHU110]|uniref:YadA-like family protein n=1 Tax=Veillonella sp. CHU110 TaxID=2490947 RepID=UPI0013DF3658|nr:YadA-like family protein [Veillonella sp. CHU110]